MSQWEEVAEEGELQSGGRMEIIVDEIPALLLRAGDDYYAIEDLCTHDGQPLSDGPVENCEITCPRHGARFDLKTGKALCMPATEPVRVFSVEVRDGKILVEIED